METDTGVDDKPTRGSAYVKSMSKLYDGQGRSSQRQSNFRVPNADRSGSLYRFTNRCDERPSRPNYRRETFIVTPVIELKYKPNDAADIKSREPSFAKFKIPYEMICAKRYSDWKRAYEAQLEHEINQNIDFQRTAADACYFVR
ncbi:GH23415 [Drosophila grimshawi]|nr:GH23415 [Drosophila grimshawi]